MCVKQHREAIMERKHDHSNFCLKTSAVELFQNLENVNLLTEKNEHEMKYQKLNQNQITSMKKQNKP